MSIGNDKFGLMYQSFKYEQGMVGHAVLAIGFVAAGRSLKDFEAVIEYAKEGNMQEFWNSLEKLPNILENHGANRISFALFKIFDSLLEKTGLPGSDKLRLVQFFSESMAFYARQLYIAPEGPKREDAANG